MCVRGCVGARVVGKAATVLRQGEARYLLTMASGDQGTTQATRWVPLFLARGFARLLFLPLSFSRKLLPRGRESGPSRPRKSPIEDDGVIFCYLLLVIYEASRGDSVTALGLACFPCPWFPSSLWGTEDVLNRVLYRYPYVKELVEKWAFDLLCLEVWKRW